MNITVTAERPQNDQVVATLTVPAADVDKAIAQTYRDIAQKYAFQGFRRGRAPRPVIDSMVGRSSVLAQATEDVMNEAQPLMFEELDIVPVDRPNYGDDPVTVVEHEDLTVTCTVSVPPTCELDSYDAPAINMPPQEATEAEIDMQVEQLLSYHVSYEDETEDRAVVAGDVIVADVQNKEGAPELAGTDRQLGLSNAYLPSEFVDGIVGMTKGQTKDIEWTRAHDDHEHHVAVTVTLKGIKKSVTPELDDEFAKKSFGFDTVAELRDAVKEEIEGDKKNSLPGLKEDRVVEEIGKHLNRKETTVRIEVEKGLREVEARLGKNFLTLITTDTPDSLAAAARTLDRAVARDTGTGSLEDYFDSEFIAQLKAATNGTTSTASPDIELLQQTLAYVMQFSKARIHDELHALDAGTLAYVAALITGTGGNSNDQYMFAQKLRNEASK